MVAGCSNTYKDGVSLFLFPKDEELQKKWAQQVKRGRDKWKPSAHSVVCSHHFDARCFEPGTQMAESLGFGKQKLMLKDDAVPTLFTKPVEEQPARKRRAAPKSNAFTYPGMLSRYSMLAA